jgi:biotin carboxylase
MMIVDKPQDQEGREAANIFVFGLDDFNLAQLLTLGEAGEYRFHELFRHDEVKAGPEFPVERLLREGRERLEAFAGPIDAIVGYWDFPVSTMLPLLREPYGLPSPDFEAVLKCEHKYWSRVEQQRAVPEFVPAFCDVDPFSEDAAERITVDYPFWIKPVKSASSHLGFMVRDQRELAEALRRIRSRIFRFANPFNLLLEQAELPPDIVSVDGNHCIVEQIISQGRQCTLEGWAHEGEIEVYGVIDSIREGAHRSSFARYQYPSRLPQRVRQRMIDVTRRFLTHIGYDDSPFNIEFYWDEISDHIWLLEVNTRISKSHCPLFHKVDGAYHHKVMLDVALGRRPEFPHREGQYGMAAKFMWRTSHDAIVRQAPSAERVEEICEELEGVELQLHVHEGMRLSELPDQDSYSYEIAVIFVGADTQKKLVERYHRCKSALGLKLEPVS